MANPLSHQKPGPLDFAAAGFNRMIDATKVVEAGLHRPPGPDLDRLDATAEILVRNDTGSALPVRSVLVPSTPLVSIVNHPLEFQERPVAQAFAATAVTDQPCILLEPLPNGAIGRAAIAGVAVVDLLLVASNHQYAAPAVGVTAYLTTAAFGPCRVIHKESLGGSVYRAWVLMGLGRAGPGTCKKIVESISCVDGSLVVEDYVAWFPPGVEFFGTPEACAAAHPEDQ